MKNFFIVLLLMALVLFMVSGCFESSLTRYSVLVSITVQNDSDETRTFMVQDGQGMQSLAPDLPAHCQATGDQYFNMPSRSTQTLLVRAASPRQVSAPEPAEITPFVPVKPESQGLTRYVGTNPLEEYNKSILNAHTWTGLGQAVGSRIQQGLFYLHPGASGRDGRLDIEYLNSKILFPGSSRGSAPDTLSLALNTYQGRLYLFLFHELNPTLARFFRAREDPEVRGSQAWPPFSNYEMFGVRLGEAPDLNHWMLVENTTEAVTVQGIQKQIPLQVYTNRAVDAVADTLGLWEPMPPGSIRLYVLKNQIVGAESGQMNARASFAEIVFGLNQKWGLKPYHRRSQDGRSMFLDYIDGGAHIRFIVTGQTAWTVRMNSEVLKVFLNAVK